ncbi:41046_t:CDS:2, partial [Gigaspora margarita]
DKSKVVDSANASANVIKINDCDPPDAVTDSKLVTKVVAKGIDKVVTKVDIADIDIDVSI